MAKPKPSRLIVLQGFLGRLGPGRVLGAFLAGYTVMALVFAILYYSVSALDTDSATAVDYTLYSLLTQVGREAPGIIIRDALLPKLMLGLHGTASLIFFACASAVLVFKLLAPTASSFVFDRHAVFYPDDGLVRVRVLHHLPATVSNVNVSMHVRTWLETPPQNRYGTFDVPLKRTVIPRMSRYDPWNIASVPTSGPEPPLAAAEGTRRVGGFTPNLLDTRTQLTVTLFGHVDELKTSVSGSTSYAASDVVCGAYLFVDPGGLTHRWVHRFFRWENWDQYTPTPPITCPACRFVDGCPFPQAEAASFARDETRGKTTPESA